MIRFACPVCHKTYKADLGQAGRQSLCKQCGSIVVVPERPVQEVHYGVPLPPSDLSEVVEEPPPPPQSRQPTPEKYCHECGERIRKKAAICPKCGVRQPDTADWDDDVPYRPRRANDDPDRDDNIPYRSQRTRDAAGKKLAAGLCAILVGSLGVHKFLLGTPAAGVVMLVVSVVTIPLAFVGMLVMTVIGVIEGITYLSKSDREFHDVYIRRKRAWF